MNESCQVRLGTHIDLANFVTSLSPSDTPEAWLAANRENILASAHDFLASTGNHETEFVQGLTCRTRIYHRFAVFTYMHIQQCADIRLKEEFKESLTSWMEHDDISQLTLHQSIGERLWATYSVVAKLSGCHDDGYLNNLLCLDVIAVCAQLAATIRERYQVLVSQQGKTAQSLLDLFQTLLDYPHVDPPLKSPILRALVRLSRKSGLYPVCPVLLGVNPTDDHAVAGGAFGEVWRGIIEDQTVAIKMLKVYQISDARKLLQDFSREVAIWRQLSHPNVLPFYGVYHWNGSLSRVCFISPWMENGNVKQYLESVPDADRVTLSLDIALGLEYLHTMTPNIRHGDLKGANILITPSCRACLADFGLAMTADSRGSREGSQAGTLRWQPPELLDPALNVETQGRVTLASDIYSYGCVIYEVFSGNYPFHEFGEPAVVYAVLQGQRPVRPSVEICLSSGLDDEIWKLMEDCWKIQPAKRISIEEVVRRLRSWPSVAKDQRPTYEWDDSFPSKLRSTLIKHPFSRIQVVPKRTATSSPSTPSFLSLDAGCSRRSSLDVARPKIPGIVIPDLGHRTSVKSRLSAPVSPTPSDDSVHFEAAVAPRDNRTEPFSGSLGNREQQQRHTLPDAPIYSSSDNGSDINCPPSPTLSNRSSVHFATSLALRENRPEERTGISSLRLLSDPSTNRHHHRNASWASFEAGPSSAGTEPEYTPARRRHAGSDATDGTHINSRSNFQLPKGKYSDTTSAVVTPREKRQKQCDHGPDFPACQCFKLLEARSAPFTSFTFRPHELAHMVESKNLGALERLGGVDGLLKGLGTSRTHGLRR